MTLKMASMFDNIFVNTAKKINENIPLTRKSPLEYLSSQTNLHFSSHQLLLRKLQSLLTHSKVVKLLVLTVIIPIYLWKILNEYIAVSLCDIPNEPFSSGIFPDMMKLTEVIITTLLKESSRSSFKLQTNISVTSFQ